MAVKISPAEITTASRILHTAHGDVVVERLGKGELSPNLPRIRKILEEFDRLPILDHRPLDELLEYDDTGLPV